MREATGQKCEEHRLPGRALLRDAVTGATALCLSYT